MDFFQYSETEIDWLKKRDKKLARAIEYFGWIERPLMSDLFVALISYIVEQQISVKAALTVNKRLQVLCGNLTVERISHLSLSEIQSCGMSVKKAGYIKDVAEAVISGKLDLQTLPLMSDCEIIQKLSSLRGIGVWTAEMMLIFVLSRPNILSFGDLAIQRGIMKLYHHKILPKARFERYRKRYTPYCTTASLYLWELSKEKENF